jgi:hypothetical protein
MNTVTHLNVYSVQEFESTGKDGKPAKAKSWTRIGSAFPHKEGVGFNIELRAMPLDGRLVVLPPSDESEAREPASHNHRRR